MNKIILKFALIACLILIVASALPWLIWGAESDYGLMEVLGYTSMLAAMSMVFFGVRNFRDIQNGGNLTFGEGFKIGLLIALIPSLAFGLYSFIFFEFWQTEFLASYQDYAINNAKGKMSPEELTALMEQMNDPLYQSSLFQGFVMFMTVFMIGAVVAVISAVVLKKK